MTFQNAVTLKVSKFASDLYQIVKFLTLNWVSFKWYVDSLGKNLQNLLGSVPKYMAKYVQIYGKKYPLLQIQITGIVMVKVWNLNGKMYPYLWQIPIIGIAMVMV